MKKKEQVNYLIEYFQKNQPDVQSELHYKNPYQLLVATMLAAQCTDKRVNMVTPDLFEAYPTPMEMAQASVEEILSYVKSVRDEQDAGQRLRRRSPRHYGRAYLFAGRRAQDRQCGAGLRLRASRHARGHARVPRGAPARACEGCAHTRCSGKTAGEAVSRRVHLARAPLAAAARTLHLHRPQAPL